MMMKPSYGLHWKLGTQKVPALQDPPIRGIPPGMPIILLIMAGIACVPPGELGRALPPEGTLLLTPLDCGGLPDKLLVGGGELPG